MPATVPSCECNCSRAGEAGAAAVSAGPTREETARGTKTLSIRGVKARISQAELSIAICLQVCGSQWESGIGERLSTAKQSQFMRINSLKESVPCPLAGPALPPHTTN
jgi:hypothetical protein